MRWWLSSNLAIVVLLPGFLAHLPSIAEAQESCEIEKAQQLFGQQPRPVETVQRLLQACLNAGSADYRIYMLRGVMARDSGDRERAIEWLRMAHQTAPEALNPALELAFTLEAKHGREAARVYEEVLKRDPSSRPALLGLARIARGEYRLDDARMIYEQLLKTDPNDPDASNGLAWIALANRQREQGRAGFEHVLALDPNNDEARIGLTKVDDVYRNVVETSGTLVSTSLGSSWGFGARGLFGVSALDTVELGSIHYTQQLQTLTAVGVAVLPSDDVTLGYHRLVPLNYAVSLVYDYRAHTGLPTEHWIDGGFSYYLNDYLQWFGGYRQTLGAFQWDGRLLRTGLSVSLSDYWQVTATVYDSAQAIFQDYRPIVSGVFDVTYYGPRNMLVVAGVGYSPLIDNVDLHIRTILPVTDRVAVQLVVGHNSVNADTRALVGLRFNW
jgi:tetratricopeptide (TPR) repeat protein